MINKKQDIPTSTQLFNEFGLHLSNICLMKKREKGRIRLKIYRDAWLFRTIINFMPILLQKKFERVIPSASQLVEEFGTTSQNFSQLKTKGTKMYNIYIDAWNLHNVIFKRIIEE